MVYGKGARHYLGSRCHPNGYSRPIHRPQLLKQRVTVTAHDSEGFRHSLEGLASLAGFLDQSSLTGAVIRPRSSDGSTEDGFTACTNLFTNKRSRIASDECPMPEWVDPQGKVLEHVRRKGYCYTTENVVQYGEISSIGRISYAKFSTKYIHLSIDKQRLEEMKIIWHRSLPSRPALFGKDNLSH